MYLHMLFVKRKKTYTFSALKCLELGRGSGRGSGRGTHVDPWLTHANVWQKLLQYCKVISLQLIKINGGKKRIKKANKIKCLEGHIRNY